MQLFKTISRFSLAAAAGLLISACVTVETRIYDAGVVVERARSVVEEIRLPAGDGELAALYRAGDAGAPVVLLHGFASQKEVWLQFIRELPEDRAVLALDIPGHGDSLAYGGPDYTYDVYGLASAVIAVIDALPGDQVHLVGTSLGGAISLAVAGARPDKVLSLGLFNPAGAREAETEVIRRAIDNGDNPLIARDREAMDALIDLIFYDPPTMPWPVRSILTRYHAERADMHQRIWDDLWAQRQEIAHILQQIGQPVLLVWGEEDRIFDVRGVDIFEAHLRDVRTIIVPAAGHTVILEEVEDAAQWYTDFLREVQ